MVSFLLSLHFLIDIAGEFEELIGGNDSVGHDLGDFFKELQEVIMVVFDLFSLLLAQSRDVRLRQMLL